MGLPPSSVIIVAKSIWFSSIKRCRFLRTEERSLASVFAQIFCASFAAVMAKMVSSAPQLGSDPSLSELAGLVTSDEEPSFASIHSPLI